MQFSDLVIQCRKRNAAGDTTNPLNYFQKGWSEYKEGFGDLESDYWVGLETLHTMTSIEGSTWRLEVSILFLHFELLCKNFVISTRIDLIILYFIS